jgi:MFS family permease
MRLIRQLFGGFAAARIRQAGEWWRRGMLLSGVMLACTLLALCGLGFIAAGAYLSLREIMLPWQAALVVGGALLAISLIGVLCARFLLVRRPRAAARKADAPNPPHEQAPLESMADMGRRIGADLSRNGVHPADLLLGALLAGALLGASPGLRDNLLRRRQGPCGHAAKKPGSRQRGN